jgi:hypothetical protein
MGPGNRRPADDLVPLGDQVLDSEVNVGIDPEEHRPNLLQGFRPGRANRQRRADHRIRLDELVDRLRDDLDIAGVGGVMEALEQGLVGCHLGCRHAGLSYSSSRMAATSSGMSTLV